MSDDPPPFNGSDYVPEADDQRLRRQLVRVRTSMVDGHWRTLGEIAEATGDPQASISAQLRHLRKERFGGWVVEKRARGDRSGGLFEYRLLAPTTPALVPNVGGSGGPRPEVPNSAELVLAVEELRRLAPLAKACSYPYSATLIKVGKWLAAGAPRA